MLEWGKAIQDLEKRRNKSLEGGGLDKIIKQHNKGKLTARERLDMLFDKETFVELFGFVESRIDDFDLDKKRVSGDGVVVGYGEINGNLVFASSEDFTVMGGTLGEYHAIKICKLMDKAIEMKAPIIFINDSGGARIEEGIASLSGYSDIFLKHIQASGVIPQISIVLGPCAGGACYGPALCDFIFTVKKMTKMFITGPEVVKTVINEIITMEDLGGARVHTAESGVAHFCYDTELDCIDGVKKLFTYVVKENQAVDEETRHKGISNNLKSSLVKIVDNLKKGDEKFKKSKSLTDIVPDNPKKPYDMHEVINCIFDKDSFFEVQRHFAKNSLIGFARLNSVNVALVCNQPSIMGGSLDCDASDKMARFIRFCDCFDIPLITLVDVPAFFPGKKQEHAGIIRHGAKLLYAYSDATVPKISVILRKAYGGAYIAMDIGADIVYAWPISEIAVMGAEGAANVVFKNRILSAENPENEKKECIEEYEKHFLNPYLAAKFGFISEVIKPDETRERLISALSMLKNKKSETINRKHGNIPL